MQVILSLQGVAYPLTQLTLRRKSTLSTLDFTAFGLHQFAIGSICILSVSAHENITAVVTASYPSAAGTHVTAQWSGEQGARIFTPWHRQSISTGRVRTPLDFNVLPGDTYLGAIIESVTCTMGVNSPWFTEVEY